mmetsp:Transcript_9632/g.17306  ORF Transcript_9632/g.17306 Transcript_9632/m.17306 type:complete len:207 (-) Transcript_9632:52-672(-)
MKCLAIASLLCFWQLSEGLRVNTSTKTSLLALNRTLAETPLAHLVQSKPLPSADLFRSPKVWGPPTWFFLHSMTFALPDEVPEEEQQHVQNLMLALQQVLPCPTCSYHLTQEMDEDPIDAHLSKREDLVDWMIALHNKVNKRTGKPILSRDEVLEEYLVANDKSGESDRYMAVLGPDSPPPKKSAASLLQSFSVFILGALQLALLA